MCLCVSIIIRLFNEFTLFAYLIGPASNSGCVGGGANGPCPHPLEFENGENEEKNGGNG